MTAARRGPLEPDVAAALAMLDAVGRPPFETLTVAQARALYLAGRETVQLARVPVLRVVDISLGDPAIGARLYQPRPLEPDERSGGILFFHGGGGVIGDLETHDSICRRLANTSGRTLVAVDYRLGPENRFPAAAEDAISAYLALVAGAHDLAVERNDIAIAGDSAGGALALMTAQAAAEKLLPASALVLFYPVVDLRGGTPSYREVDGVPMTGRTMKWFCDHYLSNPADAADVRASPLLATTLAGLPPTFVTSAGHDPLCDEAFLLVGRLRECGVLCQHRHLSGQIHGYLTLGRLIKEADRSIDAAGIFLKHQLRSRQNAHEG